MKITKVLKEKHLRVTHFELSTQKRLDSLCLMFTNCGFSPVVFTDIDFSLNRGSDTLYVNLVENTAKLINIIR